jgi:pimeloyl-ACP methyl ester carboxylesterase
MSLREIDVQGRTIQLYESGSGNPPLLYLHGIADMHGLSPDNCAFHDALAEKHHVFAPAMPGCVGSDEDNSLESIDDLRFHTLEVMDELKIEKINIIGNCVGGWLAAEIAVHNPERVGKLVLVGAPGLFVSGQQIGDLFMAVQPLNGKIDDVRHMLFEDGEGALAEEWIPDELTGKEQGMLRYKTFRCIARFGFKPPYFYDQKLVERLYRFKGQTLVVSGDNDAFVPRSHAAAYAEGFPNSSVEIIDGCGHAVHLEAPYVVAEKVLNFLN